MVFSVFSDGRMAAVGTNGCHLNGGMELPENFWDIDKDGAL